MTTNLIPNEPAAADSNRLALEQITAAGETAVLGPGTYHVNGFNLRGGAVVGVGPESIVKNSVLGGGFPQSSSVWVYPEGLGYADTVKVQARRTVSIDPALVHFYPPGSMVNLFVYDGYQSPTGQLATRRRVVDNSNGLLNLDGDLDKRLNRAKYMTAAVPVARGDNEGSALLAIGSGPPFDKGDTVFVSDGATLANSDHGEWRRVVSANATVIELDRPLRRTYGQSCAIKMRPVSNVVLRDLTIDQPATATVAAFFKYCTNWLLERVTVPGTLAFGSSADITLTDCNIGRPDNDALSLNACHDVRAYGCRFNGIVMEEGCLDIDLSGGRCEHGWANGVKTSVGCERIRLHGMRITDPHAAGISIGGRECLVEDVTVAGGIGNSLTGERSRLRNWRSDSQVVLYAGVGLSAANVRAPLVLGWSDGSHSSGSAVNCPTVQQVEGNWVVI